MDKEQEMLDCIFELEESNKNLKAENQRLKEQLKDYEKALKKYADKDNWCFTEDGYQLVFVNDKNDNGFEIAQEVLKKIERKE